MSKHLKHSKTLALTFLIVLMICLFLTDKEILPDKRLVSALFSATVAISFYLLLITFKKLKTLLRKGQYTRNYCAGPNAQHLDVNPAYMTNKDADNSEYVSSLKVTFSKNGNSGIQKKN